MTKTTKTKATKTTEQPKENAALRLAKIENKADNLQLAVQAQQQSLQLLSDELDKLRELILGVARRLNTAILAAENGNLSMESVNTMIRDQNAQTLKSTVDNLISEGLLIAKDGEILENDFVVGREVDLESGAVLNPRLQFAMASMPENVTKVALGKKVGDKLFAEGEKTAIEILEVYSIRDEKELELEEDSAKQA